MSLSLLIGGILVALLAGFFVIRSTVETFTDGGRIETGESTTLDLDAGGWRVYQGGAGFGGYEVSITGPDGPVELRRQPLGITETLGRDGQEYTAVLRFDIEESGSYTITVDGSDAADLRVGRSLSHVGLQWPWMAAGALATITALVGLVLTIITFRNRGRARRFGWSP